MAAQQQIPHSFHHEAWCLMEAVMRDDEEDDNVGGYECDDEEAGEVEEAAFKVRREMEEIQSVEGSKAVSEKAVSEIVRFLREKGDAINEQYKMDPVLQNPHMQFDLLSTFTSGVVGELYDQVKNDLCELVSKQIKPESKVAILGSVGKGVQTALRENGQHDPIELRFFKLLASHFIVDEIIPVGTSSVKTLRA